MLNIKLHELFRMQAENGLSDLEERVVGNLRQLNPTSRRVVDKMISTMVDEFEEMVYTNAAALDGSVEQLDKFMAEICVRYGGKSFIEEYMTDVSSYWKYVVIESPVYYISYAVSGISAMSFYGQVASNYNAALEIYQAFTAGELIEDAFLENLKNAGVSSPFEEKAYTDIAVAWATRNRSK